MFESQTEQSGDDRVVIERRPASGDQPARSPAGRTATAVAAFLVSVTPVMHDCWTVDDPEQKQQ